MDNNITISSLWRIVKTGGFLSIVHLKEQVRNSNFEISKWADDLAEKSEYIPSEVFTEIGIIRVTILNDPITYKDLCEYLFQKGKGLCTQLLTLEFCSQYPDWNEQQCLCFAAKPVIDKSGHSVIFRIQTDTAGKRHLCSQIAHDQFRCYPGDTYLFTEKIITHFP